MRYRVFFHAMAAEEAVAAASFIAGRASPEIARRWYEGLEHSIRSLETMPSRYGLARESDAFPSLELRQIVYQSHRVIFTIREDEVHILHVRHTAQSSLESRSSRT